MNSPENSRYVTIIIPGDAVGKGRPRFARRGKHVSTYTPEKTATYENHVKSCAKKWMAGHPLFLGAVKVEFYIDVLVPASWSEKKRKLALAEEILPTTKPDIDNVMKSIFDACNGIVWVDDKQITDIEVVKKRYNERAGVVLMVGSMS